MEGEKTVEEISLDKADVGGPILAGDGQRSTYTYTELEIDYSKASWRVAFTAAWVRALWPVLMPTAIIWSRLRRRPVRIGVTKERVRRN